MRRQILGMAATAGLLAAGTSHAEVLTFDGIPSSQTIYSHVTYGEYEFASSHFHAYGDHPYFDGCAWNGGTHLGYESGRGAPITMTRTDGGSFSLEGLDASEFYSFHVADRPNAQLLDITGTLAGGGTVTQLVNLDGIFDGVEGQADFQTFQISSLFTNVTSVVFTGLRLDGNSGGVTLDNIRVSVPEPGTLALLGAGLLLVGAVRRRKAGAGSAA
jgi:hypothetical protein